jgi:hypothetical protein
MADATVTFAAKDLNLGSTIDKLKRELSATQEAAKSSSKGFDLSFGKIGIAAGVAGAAVKVGMMAVEAATASARAVVDGFGDAINLGADLDDLSSRTGETAGNLVLLQRAFVNAGVSSDKMAPSINKLQKFMADAAAGGAAQTATLDALGISMADLAGKTPTEQMQIFASKIGSISDPSERARAAMEVFGKSGGELLPLLNNFSTQMDGARNQLGSLPGVMDRSAAAFGVLSENFETIGTKTKEFAAGFIEAALPALNIFTSALTGVDAAGFGQKLMSQVMNVADFLIGAFQTPMPAIEAIGAALIAGVKTAGNNYLNALIDAGKFLSAFFSSGLPGIISGVLGNTLIKSFIDSAKAFIDAIRGVITAFETWLGNAITNVVDFFTTKFSGVLSAVAQDFQSAMSDPIGFVSGKLDSALAGVMNNGGNTFQTSFEKAGGSALDKISAGLGAVSDEYGAKIVKGSIEAKEEMGDLVDKLEKSDKDFFGAKDSMTVASEKLAAVTESGKKLREEFEKSATSADAANKSTSGAVTDAEAIAGSFDKVAGSAAKAKEELSESAKLFKSIEEARAKDAVDRGGRDAQRAQDAIDRGDFRGAERAANRIAAREERQGRQAGEKQAAEAEAAKPLSQRLAEGQQSFRERFAKSDKPASEQPTEAAPKSLRDRMAEGTKSFRDRMAGSDAVDKPGRTGQTDKDAKGGDKAKSSLDTLVGDIKKLLEKIEPRLPVAALV